MPSKTSTITTVKYKLNRLYQLYYYNSPIPVLTTNETIIFNIINLTIVLVGIYYIIKYLPLIVLQSIDKLYYYITGYQLLSSGIGGYTQLNYSLLLLQTFPFNTTE